MKKQLFLALILIFAIGMVFATGTPRVYLQRCSLDTGLEASDVTNTGTTTSPNYIVRATNLANNEVLGTDLGQPASTIRINRSGASPNFYTATNLQLGSFPTQWVAGNVIRMYVQHIATGQSITWDLTIPTGTTLINIQSPIQVIPPATVVADTWAYGLQVNGPAGTAFTGPQNGTMPQLLAAPDTDEENELLGVYTAAAAPAGFHWVVNPITVTPADFTGAKVAHVYNGTITFVLEADPDTYAYNLYMNGPAGTVITGPVGGILPYMETRDNAAALIGVYTAAAAPAGFHWVMNPITVIADDFVLAGKTNFVYNATKTFELAADPDVYVYNLYVTGPDGYAVAGPVAGVTDYLATWDNTAALVGDYTIAAAPAGFHWAVNPITVVAGDFIPAVKATYIYNATITFELVADPAPLVITPVTPADVPAGYPMPEGTEPTAAYIVTWSGVHDLFIARGVDDTNAYAFIGGTWVAPTGSPDWTWLAVNFDAKAPVPVIILGPSATYQLLVEAHELGFLTPDLNAEILLNGLSFPTPIFTPYTFGITGNYTWVPGTYSVVKTGYASWIPDSITFVSITADYAVDFQGIPEDGTPVELSSFTATLTAETYVQLTWVSQSEAQMMGYLVYRNTTADQSTSVLIDHPMVPATNTSSTQTYTAIDNDVTIGTTYYYWLEAVDYTNSTYHGPVSVTVNGNVPPVLPEVTTMRNAYPNPFNTNGRTNIEVSLKGGENGTITIYNVLGQVVKTFNVTEGNHTVNWNGRDSKGNNCGSGIYFYKLSTPSMNVTKKMVIVK